MSQQVEDPFSNWSCFQARLLYSVIAKAVTASKRETVERRMVIEDDLL
jgi:hypothetical protein